MQRRPSPRLPAAAARRRWLVLSLALAGIAAGSPADARAQAGAAGELAAGPYRRLLISNAHVIPGHGGPPMGPLDVVVERDVIAALAPGGSVDPATAERVIDGRGRYVLPGFIDLHTHIRSEPMELEYVYFLKLAHGVTTMVNSADRGHAEALEQARLSALNQILAPRMFPITIWGMGPGGDAYGRDALEDPAQAPRIAADIIERGGHVVDVGRGGLFWTPDLLRAVAAAVREAGGITTFHLPPETTNVIDAVDAACAGVTQIEHHYGYPEAALDRQTQDFLPRYDYFDEVDRFRQAGRVWSEVDADRLLTEVADTLVSCGVSMVPTRVVYEANRDILRASSLPWHEKYTHQKLLDWSAPNLHDHGAFHYDWTSDDEATWALMYGLWGRLIYEFNRRGGRVAYGSDDNFIWATPGFSNIRELQLLRETGLHSLEVLKAATYNAATTLRQPRLGLVHPGYAADLIVVDGNPAYNLRFLYGFGALTRDAAGAIVRTDGIVHTIKAGVVIENASLLAEVAKMVARSKRGRRPHLLEQPFVTDR